MSQDLKNFLFVSLAKASNIKCVMLTFCTFEDSIYT